MQNKITDHTCEMYLKHALNMEIKEKKETKGTKNQTRRELAKKVTIFQVD